MIIKLKVLNSPFFILGNFDPFRFFETNVFLYCVITNHLKTNIDLKENHSYIYIWNIHISNTVEKQIVHNCDHLKNVRYPEVNITRMCRICMMNTLRLHWSHQNFQYMGRCISLWERKIYQQQHKHSKIANS